MTTDNDQSMEDAALAKLNELAGSGQLKIITNIPNPDAGHDDNAKPSYFVLHDVESIEGPFANGTYRAVSVEYAAPGGTARDGEMVRDFTQGRPSALLKRLTEHAQE